MGLGPPELRIVGGLDRRSWVEWPWGFAGGLSWRVERRLWVAVWRFGPGGRMLKELGREEGILACLPLVGWGLLVLLGKDYDRKTLEH